LEAIDACAVCFETPVVLGQEMKLVSLGLSTWAIHPSVALDQNAFRAEVTPVQKVIQILGSMLEKGKKEKHEEEVRFAAYREWCSNVLVEKGQSVTTALEQIDHLKADIQASQTEAEELSVKINEIHGDVATWQGDVKAATNVRSIERNTYIAEHKDYSESIDAIGRAVQVLKQQAANKPQADALLQKVMDSAPAHSKQVVETFLAQIDDAQSPPEANGYEFRSHSVIDMLEKLNDKFVEERTSLEREEVNKKHAYEILRQELTDSVRNAEDSVTSKTQRRAKALQAAAGMKGDLDDTTTSKTDDEKFARDTKASCGQKDRDFAGRQQLRADEIIAIEKAMEILSGPDVGGSAEKHLPSFVQQVSLPALLQIRSSDAGRSPNQLRVAAYLHDQAEKFGSQILSALSIRAEQDPFAKVKTMLRDLITKLQEEAGEEAEHKGWCDKELAENKKVRTTRSSTVETLSSTVDELQSSIAKTAQDITVLSTAVADGDGFVASQTKIRQQDKKKNEETIKDAQEAQAAVSRAITVLQEFYARAGEATALVQNQHAQDPPASFDEPYQGMGAESGGILGMLEVVQSDFARLESETSASEATSQQDYGRFMSESAVDKVAKTKDIEHKQSKKGREEQELVETQNDLTSTQKELDAALKYFDQLKPSCLDQGDSYEEKEARRKEEIESLREALRILNGEDIALVQSA